MCTDVIEAQYGYAPLIISVPECVFLRFCVCVCVCVCVFELSSDR